MEIIIRPMQMADLADVARLAGLLDRSTNGAALISRLELVVGNPDHVLLVAIGSTAEGVVGFVHARRKLSIVDDPSAEIAALAVDSDRQGQGIGRQLMAAAENWAVEKKLTTACLRSRVHREAAHRFYTAIGYEKRKTSYTFVKDGLTSG